MSSTVEGKPKTGVNMAHLAGKYLSFLLSKEEYGIEILKVREIIGMVCVTPLPRTADYVKGVINLRGRIIPVIDLRLCFGMPAAAHTGETCIVVVDVDRDGDGNALHTGCIVDSVSEVLNVDPAQCEAAPRCAHSAGDHISGLGKLPDRVLILLDIDRLIGSIGDAGRGAG